MSQTDRSQEIFTWAGYVRQAQLGDASAQEALFSETYHFAYYTALQYMKNSDDVLDMTQEAFIKVWQALPLESHDQIYSLESRQMKPVLKTGGFVNYKYGKYDLNEDGLDEYGIHCHVPFNAESSMHVGNEGYWAIF